MLFGFGLGMFSQPETGTAGLVSGPAAEKGWSWGV